MNLGKTFIGGVVGAALGVALQVGLEVYGSMEATWVPVVIGLLTGLCVRKFDSSTATGVSYLRGAISGLIALAAIVGGPNLVAKMRSSVDISAAVPSASVEAPADPGDNEEAVAVDVEEVPDEVRSLAPDLGPQTLVRRPDQFSTWQFIFMAVGMLLAYELARGIEVRYPDQEEAGSEGPPSDAADEAVGEQD